MAMQITSATRGSIWRRIIRTRTLSTTTTTKKDKVPIVGQFKNPIVAKLWAARQELKDRIDPDTPTTPTLTAKTPSESQTSISYPFSTDEFIAETYRNPWGQMRFGKIMEDLDALAGNIAFHHVDGNPLIVTASVDRIRLRRQVDTTHDQHLQGKVTWVGTSSMEIRMQCCDSNGEEWLEAYFTFVTLDPITKKPVPIPPLLVETAEERAHFELGAIRAKMKKKARQNKRQEVGKPLTEATLQIEKLARVLVDEAGPLKNMPSLADPHSILMSQTAMQNAMMAQPQVRNLHDRIFGGFLMRRAFELAYANCYVFGGAKPQFLEVDGVSFESPVDVGDLLMFHSRVLYTQPQGGHLGDYVEKHEGQPLVMMEVEAWVTEPEKAQARVSNVFNFTYALPKGTPCRKVLPANIDEARRMAIRMVADEEQVRS